jgi:hypothetical protein
MRLDSWFWSTRWVVITNGRLDYWQLGAGTEKREGFFNFARVENGDYRLERFPARGAPQKLFLKTPGGFRDCEWRLSGAQLDLTAWETAITEAIDFGRERSRASPEDFFTDGPGHIVGSGRRPTRPADDLIKVDFTGRGTVRASFVSADMQDLIQHLSPTSAANKADSASAASEASGSAASGASQKKAKGRAILRESPVHSLDPSKRTAAASDGCIQDCLQWRDESSFFSTYSTVWVVLEDARLEFWLPNRADRCGYFDFTRVANGDFSLEKLKDRSGTTLVLRTPGGFRDSSWRVTSDTKFSFQQWEEAITTAIEDGARMSVTYEEDAEDTQGKKEGEQDREAGGDDEPAQKSPGPMMVSISTPEKRAKADDPDRRVVRASGAIGDRIFPVAKRESRAADGSIQGWLEVRMAYEWFWSRRWVVIENAKLEYWLPSEEKRAGYFDFAQV